MGASGMGGGPSRSPGGFSAPSGFGGPGGSPARELVVSVDLVELVEPVGSAGLVPEMQAQQRLPAIARWVERPSVTALHGPKRESIEQLPGTTSGSRCRLPRCNRPYFTISITGPIASRGTST